MLGHCKSNRGDDPKYIKINGKSTKYCRRDTVEARTSKENHGSKLTNFVRNQNKDNNTKWDCNYKEHSSQNCQVFSKQTSLVFKPCVFKHNQNTHKLLRNYTCLTLII